MKYSEADLLVVSFYFGGNSKQGAFLGDVNQISMNKIDMVKFRKEFKKATKALVKAKPIALENMKVIVLATIFKDNVLIKHKHFHVDLLKVLNWHN